MDSNSTTNHVSQAPVTVENAVQSILIFLVMISSLISNFLVAVVLAKKSELLSASSNKFLLNLTVANFLLGLLVMPFVFASSLKPEWIFGEVWCQSSGFLNILFCCVAILTATCLSYDRYHYILNPLTYPVTMSNVKSNILIAVTWLASLFVAILPLTGWGIYGFSRSKSCCTVAWSAPMSSGFSKLFAVLTLVLPLIIMFYAYYHIIKAAKRQARIGQIAVLPASVRNSVSSDASRMSNFTGMKAVRTTLLVLGTVAVLWGPYIISTLVESNQVKIPHWTQFITVLLSLTMTILHPVIYGYRLRAIRNEVRRTLRSFYRLLFHRHNNLVRPLTPGEAFFIPPAAIFRNRSVSEGSVNSMIDMDCGHTEPELLWPCMPIIREEETEDESRLRHTDLTELSHGCIPGQIDY